MTQVAWTIGTSPDDLQEGLFGQVILWTFELLPYLAERAIFPGWDIRSRLYGNPPEFLVIPGVLDLAYSVPAPPPRRQRLRSLRAFHASVLGPDWPSAHRLWHRYFKIPQRVLAAADAIDLPPLSLGLHYRGNDKNSMPDDTNPVSQDDFLTLVEDFLPKHPEVQAVFIASDEYSFVLRARERLHGVRIVNAGAVASHKTEASSLAKADRALLDCVLLSRCHWMLKCSSALSAFAKVLNPELQAYRISASKLFSDVPYFPEAYIPRLESQSAVCNALLSRQFAGDWLEDANASAKFDHVFHAQRRFSRAQGCLNRIELMLSGLRDKPKNL